MMQILEDNDPVIAQIAFNRSSSSTLRTMQPSTLKKGSILTQLSQEYNRGQKTTGTRNPDNRKIPIDQIEDYIGKSIQKHMQTALQSTQLSSEQQSTRGSKKHNLLQPDSRAERASLTKAHPSSTQTTFKSRSTLSPRTSFTSQQPKRVPSTNKSKNKRHTSILKNGKMKLNQSIAKLSHHHSFVASSSSRRHSLSRVETISQASCGRV
jgi:hypothetical protein